jgi:hypothetical protein
MSITLSVVVPTCSSGRERSAICAEGIVPKLLASHTNLAA